MTNDENESSNGKTASTTPIASEPDSRGNYTDGFRDGWKAHFDTTAPAPSAAIQDEATHNVLQEAGAILCVNDPDDGAKVEIRFAQLKDAQRLHKTLVQMRAPSSTHARAAAAEERLITENPFEQQVERALIRAGLAYQTDHDGSNPTHLDFYVPSVDVHIEVKTMHSDRIAEQMSRAQNVIVAQGVTAIRWLATIIEHHCFSAGNVRD